MCVITFSPYGQKHQRDRRTDRQQLTVAILRFALGAYASRCHFLDMISKKETCLGKKVESV